MKVNCISCGFGVELDQAYADHYEGEVTCVVCGSRLGLNTDRGRIRHVRLMEGQFGNPRLQGATSRRGRTTFRYSTLARAEAWTNGLRHNH